MDDHSVASEQNRRGLGNQFNKRIAGSDLLVPTLDALILYRTATVDVLASGDLSNSKLLRIAIEAVGYI